jgi:hypothetical protein
MTTENEEEQPMSTSRVGRVWTSHSAPKIPNVGNVDEILVNAVAALEDQVKEQKLALEALTERMGELEAAV